MQHYNSWKEAETCVGASVGVREELYLPVQPVHAPGKGPCHVVPLASSAVAVLVHDRAQA